MRCKSLDLDQTILNPQIPLMLCNPCSLCHPPRCVFLRRDGRTEGGEGRAGAEEEEREEGRPEDESSAALI